MFRKTGKNRGVPAEILFQKMFEIHNGYCKLGNTYETKVKNNDACVEHTPQRSPHYLFGCYRSSLSHLAGGECGAAYQLSLVPQTHNFDLPKSLQCR